MSSGVTVVVVTHNSQSVLDAMLTSVRRASSGREHAVIVVDNGSLDGTPERLAHEPDVRLVRQGNTGFAHGVNRGIELADPEHDILVLNPDVVLRPDAVARLADVLRADAAVGIVVPNLYGADGVLSPSLRRDPSILTTLFETVVGGRHAGRWREAFAPATGEGPQDVDWATGAVMLLRREMIERIGLLDESFFLYSEETEYCMRARDAGFRVRFQPTAGAVHIGGEMATNGPLWALRAVNRVRLYRRRHPGLRGGAFHLAALGFELRRTLFTDRVSATAVRALSGNPERASDRLISTLGGEVALDPGSRRGLGWICFSAQDYWYHNRAHSDIQLMRRVARHEPVLLVNSLGMRMPVPGRTAGVGSRLLRKAGSMLRFVRRPEPDYPQLRVLTPVFLPFYGNSVARKLNGWLVRQQVSLVARAIGIDAPVLFVTLPTAWDAARRMRRRCLIANRSDRYSSLPEANGPVVRALEEDLLASADAAVYASHELQDEESELAAGVVRFLDHGVDLEHFGSVTEHPDMAEIPRPRAGYFGGIDDYVLDLELLAAVADRLPHVQFVLVGDATCDIDRLTRRENVHWFGMRAYRDIPAFGAGFDVALMPWLDNDWIRYCNPIKLKEYLALGLTIVSTPFPELAQYEGHVRVAQGVGAFSQAVRRALEAPAAPESLRQRVAGETWERKCAELMALAEDVGRAHDRSGPSR